MKIRVLIGYDGSPAATAALEAGAALFPGAHARVTHLWTPPYASTGLRDRLWTGTAHVDEFVSAVEREGEREAERIAAEGVTLAAAAGMEAEPLVVRGSSGEGPHLAELAEKTDADLVLVGSRGLGGARAVLGSVSDMVVHYAPRPVLVVPHPLLSAEYAALTNGPVLVGVDGSTGAQAALSTAGRLFPTRRVLRVSVGGTGGREEHAAGPPSSGATDVITLRMPAGHAAHGRAVAGALAEYARDRRAAVLVVGSRGRSAVAEIVLGSVAMAALHHAFRPVLVVPPPNRTPPA